MPRAIRSAVLPRPRVAHATIAVALCLAACVPASPSTGRPCVGGAPTVLRPLLVGDSARVVVGTLEESDCVLERPQAARWASDDPTVAEVSAAGLVRGRRTGTFRAHAVVGGDTLRVTGFVLPAGWRARIVPETATVAVGDTVRFMVRAVGPAGELLPVVPFDLGRVEAWQFGAAVLEGRQGDADSLFRTGLTGTY